MKEIILESKTKTDQIKNIYILYTFKLICIEECIKHRYRVIRHEEIFKNNEFTKEYLCTEYFDKLDKALETYRKDIKEI